MKTKNIPKKCLTCRNWQDIGKTLDRNFEYQANTSVSRKLGICLLEQNCWFNLTTEAYICDKWKAKLCNI